MKNNYNTRPHFGDDSVCIYMCVFEFMGMFVHMSVDMYLYVHTFGYINVNICLYVYANTNVFIYL
jgi:hypothetical protein